MHSLLLWLAAAASASAAVAGFETGAHPGSTAGRSGCPSSSSTPWHQMPLAVLRQQIFDDELPWAADVSTASSLDPQLQKVKRQMGMVAYELRAAEQELRLVSFEMNSYGRSMSLEVDELAMALRMQSAELSEASNKQEQLEGMLDSSSPQQQYQVHCAIQQAETAACAARARMLLLQQKLDATVHLQSVAAVAFQRYRSSTGSSAALAMGAAALVDELAAEGRGSECGSESEDEGLYSDDGELGDEPAAAAAAAAPAATAGPQPAARVDCTVVGGGSASGAAAGRQRQGSGAAVFVPLQLVRRGNQRLGPDAVVTGSLRQRSWGSQVRSFCCRATNGWDLMHPIPALLYDMHGLVLWRTAVPHIADSVNVCM